MAKIQPWHRVISPREDLREGKPLDASEFAVHLDKVRLGTAHEDYAKAERFFDRTYLTHALTDLAAEVVRRLSGEITETSPVFNMATQFGGGKTHALALLFHLAKGGSKASQWRDVSKILSKANISSVPDKCAIACFIGTDFDSLTGRGGDDGSPLRKTPWGEIAYQLGGETAFARVAEHDAQFTEPKGDVIESFLPKDRPCLILMDEIINYVSTYRDRGYHNKMYNFIQSLSEVMRGRKNAVLVVSIPASELSYTDKDEQDQQRFKNMLDRVGKAVLMSVEADTSEIIRRRLFEWEPKAVSEAGKVLLPKDAVAACREYARWIADNRQQLPQWFPVDHAQSQFESTYPFHPAVLSVFERKWQEMPRFQQTRGVLRLLALWVSDIYSKSYKENRPDLMIGLGSAPLENPLFRTALLEQLGEPKLEGVLTTDICGKKDSHAMRLDAEAVDTLKKTRLHQKAATVVFFESNGGQWKNEASVPEIRLAVSEPDLDIGNVETVLESLYEACYYLQAKGNQYYFSPKENLNKRFADRSAGVKDPQIDERVKEEIQKAFPKVEGVEIVFFPEKSSQILDRPIVTMVVMGPDQAIQDTLNVMQTIETMTREHGQSARTYKSALIFAVPESAALLRTEAKKLIAWETIRDEGLNLDDAQSRQLDTNLKRAHRDFKESVWRTYKNITLLDKDNNIRTIDLGIPTSSSGESMTKFIINHLRQTDEIEKDSPSPRFLVKHWSPAFTEWSTKAVRDAFFASPIFPRLLNAAAIKDTIARGVAENLLAYVGKSPAGGYDIFKYKEPLDPADVDISDDMFIIKADEAEKYVKGPELTKIVITPVQIQLKPGNKQTFIAKGLDQHGRDIEAGTVDWSATGGTIGTDGVYTAGQDEGNFVVTAKVEGISATASIAVFKEETPPLPLTPPPGQAKKLVWSGNVAPQKWMNFYTKVLTKHVQSGNISLRVSFEVDPADGVTDQQVEETKAALRELGLSDDVRAE